MVAFVLSGGASRGVVQVGMLRALIEAGIEPDALFGTSVGAINASVIAHPATADRLDVLTTAWRDFAKRPPIRPSLVRNALAAIGGRRALADPSPLQARLEETFGDARIEEATVPLFVTATNLHTGRERLFEHGGLAQVLMASCAVPGLFPPVEIDGVPYIDGLLYGAPAKAAMERGHDTLYLLLTNSILPAGELPTTWWGIARRAATMIMWNQLTIPDGAEEPAIHVVPAPPAMATVGRWDFSRTEQLLSGSYETASRWIAALLQQELVS